MNIEKFEVGKKYKLIDKVSYFKVNSSYYLKYFDKDNCIIFDKIDSDGDGWIGDSCVVDISEEGEWFAPVEEATPPQIIPDNNVDALETNSELIEEQTDVIAPSVVENVTEPVTRTPVHITKEVLLSGFIVNDKGALRDMFLRAVDHYDIDTSWADSSDTTTLEELIDEPYLFVSEYVLDGAQAESHVDQGLTQLSLKDFEEVLIATFDNCHFESITHCPLEQIKQLCSDHDVNIEISNKGEIYIHIENIDNTYKVSDMKQLTQVLDSVKLLESFKEG